jgi:hypothetical protein
MPNNIDEIQDDKETILRNLIHHAKALNKCLEQAALENINLDVRVVCDLFDCDTDLKDIVPFDKIKISHIITLSD